jgi:ABC-2 type transport system permease protein
MSAVTTTTTAPTSTVATAPSTATYIRYELLRMIRNRRFFVFSLVFPLVLFVLVAGPNKDQTLQGIPFPTYYMAGMVSWGAMVAVVAAGARIAAERSVGWHRQLRVSPLSTRTYIGSKLAAGYVGALGAIVVLYVAGSLLDVRLSAAHWAEMTALILIGLVPFAVLGVLLGHVLTVDSMGSAVGGLTSLFALLGGAWGPLVSSGWLLHIVKLLPSYWLVQAGATAYGGDAWPALAWIVIVVWTAVLAVLCVRVYRRDTGRA